MNGDLGRYERMAQRARMRAAIARDNQLTGAEEWAAIEARDEWESQHSPAFLAGPPRGCHHCYRWWRSPLGGWVWAHRYDVLDDAPDLNTLPPTVADWPTPVCRHTCHGPDGLPLPIIAIG